MRQLQTWNKNKDRMVSRVAKRKMGLEKKLKILRDITGSKSVRKMSILMDAFHYINLLKHKILAINSQYLHLISPIQHQISQEVKVERIKKGFVVSVNCKKTGQEMLVSILEGFEEIGLDVLHVRVNCCNKNNSFSMEAITEIISNGLPVDVRGVKQAVLKALIKIKA